MRKVIMVICAVISTPFVVCGFVGNFIVGSYKIGVDLSMKFFEWVDGN